MDLYKLTQEIRSRDMALAPGSETDLWGDYLEDCRKHYGCLGNTDAAMSIEPSPDFVLHWTETYALREMGRE